MQNANEQELIQCPYEPSHQILKARFQVHLGRCRRNHKDVPKETCPFNVTHVLNKPELDWHVTNCPERKTFENFKYRDECTTGTIITPPISSPTTENEENWDDDPDVPTYNPQNYAAKAPVLRNIQGAPPSVRKKFRQQERLRIMELNK